jgi:catechol 2,3-dioxygenase-like lactoylglutathione lyase family enzyme
MLADMPIVAFVATARPDEARTFYRDGLGLRLVGEDDFALVFDAGGTALRVTKVEHLQPAGYTVLGWLVEDLAAAIGDLTARGVTFEHFDFLPQDAGGIWTAPDGAQIAWFKDPDRNTLSLTQPPH